MGPLGETALHVAARRRRVDAVRALAEAGVDLTATTTGGMFALRHATRRRFDDVAEALLACGAPDDRTAADHAARALFEGVPEGAVRQLPPPTVPEEGRMVADLAVAGALPGLRLLLDGGWPHDARGLDGGTPLPGAAWFAEVEVVRHLLDRGAPLDVRGDDHDSTPLGGCAHGSVFCGGAQERGEAYARVASTLLEAGASLPLDATHDDHANLTGAAPAVAAVLARHGWRPAGGAQPNR